MPYYSVAEKSITNASNATIMNLYSAGGARSKVNNIILSSGATPDDQATIFEVVRTTVSGTGTAIVPEPLDPLSVVANAQAKHTLTVEPTEVSASNLLVVSLNQRATFSWLANPGAELKLVRTSDYGISIVPRTITSTYNIDCTIFFEE